MPCHIRQLNKNTLVATLSGVLDQASYTAMQNAARELILKQGPINALIVAEDFEGYGSGVDWGNMDFYGKYADDILKMAVVADKKWETQTFLFTGAGARKTEIKFFAPGQLAIAQAWVTS